MESKIVLSKTLETGILPEENQMENKHIYGCSTCGAEIYLDFYQLHLKHKDSLVPNPEISYIKELYSVRKEMEKKKKKHFCKQTSVFKCCSFQLNYQEQCPIG